MIIIQLTSDELETVVQNAVRKAMSFQMTSVQKNENTLFSVVEAADFLNLATQTLYGYTSKRLIPFVKRGKKLYFQKEELEKWLLEGKKLTKAEIEAGISLYNKKGAKGYGK